jgi:hypothetical protein
MARGPLAGAAGPGKFSKRTDLPSSYYGEGVETASVKSGAPLAATRGVADNVGGRPASAPAVPSAPVTELFAPTTRPDEPITAGINMGAGPGSEALGMQAMQGSQKLSDILAKMIPYDTTGEVNVMYQNALVRGL